MDNTKEYIAAKIEEYHQEHYWNLFPAGTYPDWVIDAIAEKIVNPMLEKLKKAEK